jgi:transcriptional regulator
MKARPLDLLQGTLDLLVLKALAGGPQHGYGVARWIRQTTDDTLAIEDGALYTALHRLEQRGLLSARWDVSENNRRARYYSLTRKGQHHLDRQSDRLRRYADALFKVLDGRTRGARP